MTIHSLAADIADRIKEMAKDTKHNNAITIEGMLVNAGVRFDRMPMPPAFCSMTMDKLEKLEKVHGIQSMVHEMQKEEDYFKTLLNGERERCYELFMMERNHNVILSEIVWSMIVKSGGEVRLKETDLPDSRWAMCESFDPSTKEKVFIASRDPADLKTPAPSNPDGNRNDKESGSRP